MYQKHALKGKKLSNIFLLVSEIMSSLKRMEECKKIDPSILKQINSLSKDLYAQERIWLSRTDIPVKTAFTLYLAARNSRMIMEKLNEKIENAERLKQNPHVIHDVKRVIPSILEIYVNLMKANEQLPSIGFTIHKRIFDLIKSLRDLAGMYGILPTFEEDTKGIDKKTIREEFTRWDQRIWMKTVYEL